MREARKFMHPNLLSEASIPETDPSISGIDTLISETDTLIYKQDWSDSEINQ